LVFSLNRARAEAKLLRIFPPSRKSTGAAMKVSINYRHVESPKPVEREVTRQVAKLEKLLKHYSPDLVQVHGVFSRNQRTREESCALTLSLPSGALHATGSGPNTLASCKRAFSEVAAQVKKHQAMLRREHLWVRGEPRAEG
jgi:ribosome-associated translation inhibitor RaiA